MDENDKVDKENEKQTEMKSYSKIKKYKKHRCMNNELPVFCEGSIDNDGKVDQ